MKKYCDLTDFSVPPNINIYLLKVKCKCVTEHLIKFCEEYFQVVFSFFFFFGYFTL